MEQRFSLEEAAQYLNVSEKRLEKLVSAGKLPIPITQADLNSLKTQWEQTSLQARKKLAELTRLCDMGY